MIHATSARVGVLAGAVMLLGLTGPRVVAADFGAVADGDWSVPATWTDGVIPGVPGGTDRAFIGGGYVAGQAPSAAVDVTATQAVSEVYVSFWVPGEGALRLQPGGHLTAHSRMHVGAHPGGTGTVVQTGGVLDGAGDMTIGEGGAGAVTISDGIAIRHGIYVALGAPGALTVTGGAVTNTATLVAGYSGGGSFTGRVSLTDSHVTCGQTQVGGGATGIMAVSNAWFSTVGLFVAAGVNGTLDIADAIVTNTSSFMVGHAGGDSVTGRVSLSGGRLYAPAGQFGVGSGAVGRMTVSNAWLSTGQLYVGYLADGWFSMTDSVLTNEWGGYRGGISRSGHFLQVRGSNLVDGGEFWMGESAGTTNSYTIMGQDAFMRATTGRQLIGVYGGSNTFNHVDGTVMMHELHVGFFSDNTAAGIYNLFGGTLNVAIISNNLNPNTSFNFAGGTLSAGQIGFTLINRGGTLSPGLTNSIGKTHIDGGYQVQSVDSILAIQLAGTAPGVSHDQLVATGGLILDGTLEVRLGPEYTPDPLDTFEIVTGASVSGVFANAAHSGGRFNLGDASFVVTYTATGVTLSDYRPPSPPGGFRLHIW